MGFVNKDDPRFDLGQLLFDLFPLAQYYGNETLWFQNITKIEIYLQKNTN